MQEQGGRGGREEKRSGRQETEIRRKKRLWHVVARTALSRVCGWRAARTPRRAPGDLPDCARSPFMVMLGTLYL